MELSAIFGREFHPFCRKPALVREEKPEYN